MNTIKHGKMRRYRDFYDDGWPSKLPDYGSRALTTSAARLAIAVGQCLPIVLRTAGS